MTSLVVRAATTQDAEAAVAVLRDSITRLCVADHRNDPATVESWLRNKTPEQFQLWLADPDRFLVVAEVESVLSGVGMIDVRGDVRLCYVSPARRGQGVGRAILRALEARASSWNLEEIRIGSTLEARSFYEHHGFRLNGEAVLAFGVLKAYPYVKSLRAEHAAPSDSLPDAVELGR